MAHITPADQYVTCDLAFFFIEEIELLGNTIFSVSGVLESVSAEPALTAAWLIGSDLYGCRFVYYMKLTNVFYMPVLLCRSNDLTGKRRPIPVAQQL